MPDQIPQNIENHVRTPTFIIVLALMCFLALILTVVGMFTSSTVIALGLVITTMATLGTAAMARTNATRLQDRIVRLEMRLRLAQLLDEETKDRIPDLTLSQLIALRFASDTELPDLTRKVLNENITTQKEIKLLVTDWQSDYHRV